MMRVYFHMSKNHMGYAHLRRLLQQIGLLVTERDPSVQILKIINQPQIFIILNSISFRSKGD